jgi:hypothetical protein
MMSITRAIGVGIPLALLLVPAAARDRVEEAMQRIRPEAFRAHMRFLADDLLEGRGTATRGHEIAAAWMATQFEAIGLAPAGDAGGYLQRVPLRSARTRREGASFVLSRGGGRGSNAGTGSNGGNELRLEFGSDFYMLPDPSRADSAVDAPLVFVRYGVTAPSQGYDDYKGIDARGKIVVQWYGAPNFESTVKAHYSSAVVKASNAALHGAVGMITLATPEIETRYPFEKQVRALAFPRFNWLDREGKPNDYFPELKVRAFVSLPAAQKFFGSAGAGADPANMPASVRLRASTVLADVTSPNVIARLEGSDPALKDEYVVFSAHLDHLGIGEPVNGDAIYNGAIDNAAGSANLVEIARALGTMQPRPKRSLLFVSVTAEEAGLIGSDYFAQHPTVPKRAIVANINMDANLMLWPLRDIIAFGAEHSTLDAAIHRAAARLQLAISPDPVPEQVGFIRSDQYSFVKQGIPAVFPVPGLRSDDPRFDPPSIYKKWSMTRYHQPNDDMTQPGLDFEQSARYARFALLCGYLVAEDPARPAWNPGNFFGEKYAASSR